MAQVMDVVRFKIIKSKGHINKQVHWKFYVHEFLVYWLRALQATQAARVQFLVKDNCLFLQSYNRERMPKVALGEGGEDPVV